MQSQAGRNMLGAPMAFPLRADSVYSRSKEFYSHSKE
jgi:hypothetical protein